MAFRHDTLTLSALALLLAACTAEDDSLTPSPRGDIAFRAEGVEAASRAAIDGVAELQGFTVCGWANAQGNSTLVFNNRPVTCNGTTWTYSPTENWQPSHSYHFLALATSEAEGGASLTVTPSEAFTSWETAVTAQLQLAPPYTYDVLYATAECETPSLITNPDPVQLTFRHALSRLVINVRATAIEGHSVRLTGLSFKPKSSAATLATAVHTTTTMIPPATKYGQPTYIYDHDTRFEVTSATPCTTPYTLLAAQSMPLTMTQAYETPPLLLIPGEMGEITVEYDLLRDDGTLVRHSSDVLQAAGLMLPGHSYRASIILPSPTQVITLQGSLTPWGGDNDNDREIISI